MGCFVVLGSPDATNVVTMIVCEESISTEALISHPDLGAEQGIVELIYNLKRGKFLINMRSELPRVICPALTYSKHLRIGLFRTVKS